MKKIFLVLVISSFSVSVIATEIMALPPYSRNIVNIRAILDSHEVYSALKGYPIDSIVRNGRTFDDYSVTANHCTLTAQFTYIPSPDRIPGGERYKLDPPSEAICRSGPSSAITVTILPPYSLVVGEFKAILNSREVESALRVPISSIVRNGQNYTLYTAYNNNDCALSVGVTYIYVEPMPLGGEPKIKLEIGQVNCLPTL